MRFSVVLASTLLVAITAANPLGVDSRSQSLNPRTILVMRDFGCNCNESSCSGPACCANGTCRCNCNESGCDAASPPCCANGTC